MGEREIWPLMRLRYPFSPLVGLLMLTDLILGWQLARLSSRVNHALSPAESIPAAAAHTQPATDLDAELLAVATTRRQGG